MPHGGERKGAGRPKGARNKAGNAQKEGLSHQAKAHAAIALNTLADVAENGRSDSARVSAAVAILDRAYGRPRQAPEEGPSIEEGLRAFALEICANAESMPIATQVKRAEIEAETTDK